MAYPFYGNGIHGSASRKLKIMAVAGGIPITKMVEQVIDHVYAQIPPERLAAAKEKLGIKEGENHD